MGTNNLHEVQSGRRIEVEVLNIDFQNVNAT